MSADPSAPIQKVTFFPSAEIQARAIPRPMKKRFGSTRPASSTQYPLGRDRLDMQAASLTAELSGIR